MKKNTDDTLDDTTPQTLFGSIIGNSHTQKSLFVDFDQHGFKLNQAFQNILIKQIPSFGFDGFGEVVYYRTYSRMKEDGTQEHWGDTVKRVIEGVMTIRKDWYMKHRLVWDENHWQEYAMGMTEMFYAMKWLPPGRGLWAMGTQYVYERGSAALNNCGAVDTTDLSTAAEWTMDMLMMGVGVGFNTVWQGGASKPTGTSRFTIPDSREGWVESLKLLLDAYTKNKPMPIFDYSMIRPKGAPIRGFGGTASGAEPLIQLHERVIGYLSAYCDGKTNETRVVADIMNAIGACVVAGNVRRSAEIALGKADDDVFLNLKNAEKYPDRQDIAWMSNNTVILEKSEDFKHLPAIAQRIASNGEPGIMNLLNVQNFGRYGKESKDQAWLANPCSEIPLESFELCNLAEVFPTKCESEEEFYKALEYATFYASTVSLLPTHRPETNSVVARNRRIGVSLSGLADELSALGATELTRRLRLGYDVVRATNKKLASEAGIPEAIRVTTVKPSGTISQLAGVSSGMHFPTFKYAIRRVRVGNDTPICGVLKDAGVPNEPDTYSANTTVFEFVIDQGKTRPAKEVSAWEQFAFLAMLQREWSDNMVSCTVYFDKERESDQVEHMLAQFAPVIKSVSMLPHMDEGCYPQMPYEGITQEEFYKRRAALPLIDWSKFGGSDGKEETFCTNDRCDIPS
jgi:ribonucleoside-triphosphate reductase (thioredoxin)